MRNMTLHVKMDDKYLKNVSTEKQLGKTISTVLKRYVLNADVNDQSLEIVKLWKHLTFNIIKLI